MAPLSVLLSEIEDPRSREGLYTVGEIVFLTMSAILSGEKDMCAIAEWGEGNEDWLKTYLPYANGTPSHDTLGRVLGRIRPGCVQAVFSEVVRSIVSSLPERDPEQDRHIAMDGKTVCGSGRHGARAAHVLHAWDVGIHQLLDFRWVDKKTNEITVMPILAEALDLQGAVVTIDAMGAHLPLINQVTETGGHCIVGLKGNQKTIREEVELLFELPPKGVEISSHEENEKDHGRIEKRETTVLSLPASVKALLHCEQWPVASVVRVRSSRENVARGTTSNEERFFLSTLSAETHPASRQARLIRDHWSVENHLHGALDVAFQEDDCKVRIANAVKNLAVLRRLAQTIVASDPTPGSISIKLKRFSWNSKKHRALTLIRFAKSLEPQEKKVITARP